MGTPGGAQALTVALCTSACEAGNYLYAGVEYSQECCTPSLFPSVSLVFLIGHVSFHGLILTLISRLRQCHLQWRQPARRLGLRHGERDPASKRAACRAWLRSVINKISRPAMATLQSSVEARTDLIFTPSDKRQWDGRRLAATPTRWRPARWPVDNSLPGT